jgi:hypothetical protein
MTGCCAALLADRKSGRIFTSEDLQRYIPGPILIKLNASDYTNLGSQLTLLARGPLAGSHRLALVPVGILPNGDVVQILLQQLEKIMPNTKLLCITDLVQAADCDHQLLITSLGGPTRSQLSALSQQLQLQNRLITGWLLLQKGSEI